MFFYLCGTGMSMGRPPYFMCVQSAGSKVCCAFVSGMAYVTLLVSEGSWGTSADGWTHLFWQSIASFVLTYFHSPLNVSCFHESSPSAAFSCVCFLSPRCCMTGYFSHSLRTIKPKKKMQVEKPHIGMTVYFPCTSHVGWNMFNWYVKHLSKILQYKVLNYCI